MVKMFIDPTEKILDIEQKEVAMDGKPMTIGSISVTLLLAQFPDEQSLPGPQKLDRFELAEKLHGASMPVEITNAQADMLLKLAEKGLPTLTYARVSRAIKRAQAAA